MMATTLSKLSVDKLSDEALFDYWRMAEVRIRHWTYKAPPSPVQDKFLHNWQLLLQRAYDEMLRRTDTLPAQFILELILSQSNFTWNGNRQRT